MRLGTERRANQLIRKHDMVQVVSGKEAGKSGKVLAVQTNKNRVLIEHVNMVKRHEKPSNKNRQGGIVDKEASVHLSNVMLVCAKCNRPVRVRLKANKKKGPPQRVCAKCATAFETMKS